MKILWCVLLIVVLVAGRGLNADDKAPNAPPETAARTDDDPNDPSETATRTAAEDPNDPNELLGKKWDAVIEDANKPNDMLWAKWCAVVKVLQAKEITQITKGKIIDKIVSPIFDFPLMAKLVLGKKHWPKFTEPQFVKFTKLFTDKLKTSYREKISLYTDERASLKPLQRKKTGVHIPMELISKDKKMAILYRLRKVGKGWKVFDVEIEDVSILKIYRAQFDDLLSKKSVEDFLRTLEEQPARE